MSEQRPPPEAEFEQRVIARAMRDEAFRRELLADPKAALNRELARRPGGRRIPDGVEVRVVEETPGLTYLVLPPRVSAEGERELDDAELEGAAGGDLPCAYDVRFSLAP